MHLTYTYHRFRQILCLMTAALFVLSVTVSCGKKEETAAPEDSIVREIAETMRISLAEETDELSGLVLDGEQVIAFGMKDGQVVGVRIAADGTKEGTFSVPAVSEDYPYIYSAGPRQGGGFTLLFTSDEDRTNQGYAIGVYDRDAAPVASYIYGEKTGYPGAPVAFSDKSAVCRDFATLYICQSDGSIFTSALTGEELLRGIAYDGNTAYGIIESTMGGATIAAINRERKTLSDYAEIDMEGNMTGSLLMSETGTVYVSTDVALCEYDPATRTLKERFSWISTGTDGFMIWTVAAVSDNTFFVTEGYNRDLVRIQTHMETVAAPKTVLFGATFMNAHFTRPFVAYYNATHQDYQIELKIYDNNTDLVRDLGAGQAPDVLNVSMAGIPVTPTGFEDLYKYLENDPDYPQSAFPENMLDAMTIGEQLLYLPDFFCILTVSGRSEDVGSTPGWTMDEMLALNETLPDGQMLFPGWLTAREAMLWFAETGMAQCIDWNRLTCDFESETFLKTLRFCDSLPREEDFQADSLLSMDSIQSPAVLANMTARYGVHGYTAIGFPNEKGQNGALFCAGDLLLAIPSRGQEKEGAWDVVRAMFEEDWQMRSDISAPGFPVRKEAMSAYLIRFQQEGDPFFPDTVLTDEAIAMFYDLVEHTQIFEHGNDRIKEIILEEADACFAGAKSAEEAAALIQNRVSLYLSEME